MTDDDDITDDSEMNYDLVGFDGVSEDKYRLGKIIDHVFSRIFLEDRDELERSEIIFVLPSPSCSANLRYLRPRTNNYGLVSVWIIALHESIVTRPDNEATYSIVHELAHAFLGHTGISSSLETPRDNEIAADRKVIEWGFEKELRESPYNYLYGSGFDCWG